MSAVLAGPYGHPFHPILVTLPIGAWVSSLVFDVSSRIVGDPGFLTKGSVWLIAIGLLGALAAATIGVLDLMAIPTGTPAFRTGVAHMSLNLAVTASYAVNLVWRHTDYGTPDAVDIGRLALSAVSLAGLATAGYLGGRLVFRDGVRVADEATQAAAFEQRSLPGRHP
ncbi:hypothetical protein BTZ20_5318 [Rhodococcus sp. MTM3W5.2]|nr:hypothetical protein BTZ20_5318 [Rhodococcus sp. MTM3W5.2]